MAIFCIVLNSFHAKAQQSIGGTPYSFNHDISINFSKVSLPALETKRLKVKALANKNNGLPLQVGEILKTNYNISNSGTWSILPNGDRVWRLKIDVPNALATSLYFENFYLPKSAKLFIYNEDHSHVIGAFTEKNNLDNGYFATEIVYSNSCIIEYYEPEIVRGQGHFSITGVNHIFEIPSFVKKTKVRESGDCNVDINCPEGNEWQDQKKAVARIFFRVGDEGYLCTGTLVNNVRQDQTPYFLTAEHCGSEASEFDLSQWIFYFNYETPECQKDIEPISNTVSGCVRRAKGADSDFALLEFNNPVPEEYDPYYAGWDASGKGSPSGVCIHHPAGDLKKISTYTSPLINDNSTHWRADWVRTQTNWGITEGGSSGSAIFNNLGLVVGDETGGASYCGASLAEAWDVYGKVSYSWESNGSSASEQLKPWLDPDNTGTLVLNGTYPSGTPEVVITEPTNNSSVERGEIVTIAANVTDPGNLNIVSVEFFQGEESIGIDNTEPYSIDWDADKLGTNVLRVIATNSNNKKGRDAVAITVNLPSYLSDITDLPGKISSEHDDSPNGEEIDKLIDNSSQTKYLTFNPSGWIVFEANKNYIVEAYTITSANDVASRDPKDWVLEGSNNNITWNEINSVNNEIFSSRFEKKYFTFDNTEGYKYHRLNIIRNDGASATQLAEWELFGKEQLLTSSINRQVSQSTFVYPNPIALGDILHITSQSDISRVLIYATTHELLYSKDFSSANAVEIKIKDTLQKGMYLVEVISKATSEKTYYQLIVN